jgi:hypothetical protein
MQINPSAANGRPGVGMCQRALSANVFDDGQKAQHGDAAAYCHTDVICMQRPEMEHQPDWFDRQDYGEDADGAG